MLKVLIVDDEFLVRLALKSSLDWHTLGFNIIEEAENGEDALNYIHQFKPDVVITDISMPKLDGISLIKEVKQHYPSIEFIILSCHNDFEYVREGLKLGAADYILKLSMNLEELTALLLKLRDKIQASKKAPLNETLALPPKQDKLNFIFKLFKEAFISSEHLEKEASNLGLNFTGAYFLVVLLQVDKKAFSNTFEYPEPSTYVIEDFIKNILKGFNIGELIMLEDTKYMYIFNFDSLNDYLKQYTTIQTLCHETIDLIDKFLHLEISCGMGTPIEGIENLKKSYDQAYDALKFNFYTGNKSLNLYTDLPQTPYVALEDTLYQNLVQTIEKVDLSQLKSAFFSWLDSIKKEQSLNRQMLKKIIHEFLIMLEKNIKLYIQSDIVFESTKKAYLDIQKVYYLDDIIEIIDSCLETFIEECRRYDFTFCRKEVLLAKEYVLEHFNEDIKVSTISKYINMNADYFSHIFRKETGTNFIDYLNGVRINKAKEYMLLNKYKIYEIAYMVGYKDESYFVKKFKKETGFKPLEYIKHSSPTF